MSTDKAARPAAGLAGGCGREEDVVADSTIGGFLWG
jgi:hypothetical protein